jgi:hypothetical protein
MTKPQRSANDDLERHALSNINEFGWHAVNVIEDDSHPPWTILRLAGLFTRPCVRPASASQRRGFDRDAPAATLRCPAPLPLAPPCMAPRRTGLAIRVQAFAPAS